MPLHFLIYSVFWMLIALGKNILCLSFKEKTPPVLTVLASTLTTLIENSY